jgi:hypothetical protein
MTMIFNLVIVSLFLVGSINGPAPVPHCSMNHVISQAPLSEGEKLLVNVDPIFSGYNLNITIASNSRSFARLNPKI